MTSIARRSYRGDEDFIRIRRFLIDTFALYQGPFNWLIDRWDFCRYHVLPVHTYYNVQYFGVPADEIMSFCTIWLDRENAYGNFEPVGTHIEYQGLGLGKALLHEGFRRMAAHGIRRSYIHSDIDFYRRIGFEPLPHGVCPWIKYLSRPIQAQPQRRTSIESTTVRKPDQL